MGNQPFHKLHRTSTGVKTAFLIFPKIETTLYSLHRTSTMVESTATELTCTSTGLHEFHRTFTVVKALFFTLHYNRRQRASQVVYGGCNYFV